MNYNSFLFKLCKYIVVVVNDRRIRNSDPSNYKKLFALLHSLDTYGIILTGALLINFPL